MKPINMIRFLTAIILITIVYHVNAQVKFDYDESGNQIERYTISTKCAEIFRDSNSYVEEYILNADISLLAYPNPSSGKYILKIIGYDLNNNQTIRIKVLSVNGELLKNDEIYSEIFSVDITDQPNGVYFLNIYLNDSKYLFTLIKK